MWNKLILKTEVNALITIGLKDTADYLDVELMTFLKMAAFNNWIVEDCPKCDGYPRPLPVGCDYCNSLGAVAIMRLDSVDVDGFEPKHWGKNE